MKRPRRESRYFGGRGIRIGTIGSPASRVAAAKPQTGGMVDQQNSSILNNHPARFAPLLAGGAIYVCPSIHTSPSSKNSFFQMGTIFLSLSIAYSHASNDARR